MPATGLAPNALTDRYSAAPALTTECPYCGQTVAVDGQFAERACGHALQLTTRGCLIAAPSYARAIALLCRVADSHVARSHPAALAGRGFVAFAEGVAEKREAEAERVK